MTPVGPATAQKRVSASREAVWAAFEVSEVRHEWWPETEIEFVIGGSVAESWREGEGSEAAERDASGTVDVLIRGHALGFRWQDAADPHPTDVLITLRSYDGETAVVVSETGFGRFADAADRTAEAQQGWAMLLDDLAAAVDRHPELPAVPEASTTDSAEASANTGGAEPAVAAASVAAAGVAAVSEAQAPEAQAVPFAEAFSAPEPHAELNDPDDAVGIVLPMPPVAANPDATREVERVGAGGIVADAPVADTDVVATGAAVADEPAADETAADESAADESVAGADIEAPAAEAEPHEDDDEVDADEPELLDFDEFIRTAFGDDAAR